MQTIMFSLPQFAAICTFVAVGLLDPDSLNAGNVFSCLVGLG